MCCFCLGKQSREDQWEPAAGVVIASGEGDGDECECRRYSIQQTPSIAPRPETEARCQAKAIEDEVGWLGVVQAPVVAWEWLAGTSQI